MTNKTTYLLRHFCKRCLMLIAAVLMHHTGTGTNIAATNPVSQVQHQTKHLKIGKDGRYIKRKYPQTYRAMHEFALRSAISSPDKQQVEFNRQRMAFLALEKAWNISKPDSDMRKAIKTGLLRWGWLQGDPVLNNPRPVDWYMVYMECIVK